MGALGGECNVPWTLKDPCINIWLWTLNNQQYTSQCYCLNRIVVYDTCFLRVTQIAFMCWANVGLPLATLLANDVGPMKFCPFALGWSNDFCQQCLQFANKVPTNFWRKIWWANVGSILSAKKVYNLPIRYQQILVENYDGPTMAHPWTNNEPKLLSHQLTSMWFN